MITPIQYSNTGYSNYTPLKVKNCNAYNYARTVRGGGGPLRTSFINFAGIKSGDVFIKKALAASSDERFSALLSSIDSKIKDQLLTFTPQNLDTAIKNVLKAVPDATESQVLTVMQRLTQWANYRCLPFLEGKLNNLAVAKIDGKTPVNRCFNYLSQEKRLIELGRNSQNTACIVTAGELNRILENKPSANMFINLEGFDDGVNLFSDDKKLEECTINTLLKVKKLILKKPDKTFNKALFSVLNGRIREQMKDYGYKVKTIQNINPPTRESILSQMSPYSPSSPQDIRKTIEAIGKFYTEDEKSYTELVTNIADYFNSRLYIYTKQRLIENINLMKAKIDKYITKHKIPPDNVFYIIPDELGKNKSYCLITEMFARQHGILPGKIHNINSMVDLNNYPEKTAFVLLDDFAGSGDSLANAGNYHFDRFLLKTKRHILFCPLTAFKAGIENLQAAIEIARREKFDHILTIDNSIQSTIDRSNIKFENYFLFDEVGQQAFGFEGYRGEYNYFSGCTVFPYMSPDNNSDLASFMSRLFLPSPLGIKQIHMDFYKILYQFQKD